MIYEKCSWGSNVHGGKAVCKWCSIGLGREGGRERKISWADVGGMNRWKCHDSERFVM